MPLFGCGALQHRGVSRSSNVINDEEPPSRADDDCRDGNVLRELSWSDSGRLGNFRWRAHGSIEFRFIIRNHLRTRVLYAELTSHARALARVSSFDHIRYHLNRCRRSRNRADSNEIRLSRALISSERCLIVASISRSTRCGTTSRCGANSWLTRFTRLELRGSRGVHANCGVELFSLLSRKDILDSGRYACACD